MNVSEFNHILHKRLKKIEDVLNTKAKEYVQDGDRLYNFKAAARMLDCTPAQALWGMSVKHLVSINDLVKGTQENTAAMVDEKCTDMINYLILLIAIFKEERCEKEELLVKSLGG